jgi:colicin import membrane protein
MSTLLHHAPMEPSSFTPPPPPGMLRAVGLALLAHALLIAALTWGVNWKQQDSPAVEAEIWSSVRQQAAPRAVEPPPPPPAPAPPKAEPKPAPAPPKAAPPPPDTSVRDAQIALEREKKERERKEREQELIEQRKAAEKKREQQQEAQAKREALAKAERAEKAAQDKAAREKAERAEKAAREKSEKAEQAERAERAEKAARERAEKAEKAAAEARRQDNIRRMQGLAGASGGSTATGSALQSSGPSASYGARVSARVRPNIVFPDTVPGNPTADVEVRAAPDGTIVSRRLVKSSGNKAWDDAVLRAIDKTETLPRDTDGRVPSLLVIGFKPKE